MIRLDAFLPSLPPARPWPPRGSSAPVRRAWDISPGAEAREGRSTGPSQHCHVTLGESPIRLGLSFLSCKMSRAAR